MSEAGESLAQAWEAEKAADADVWVHLKHVFVDACHDLRDATEQAMAESADGRP